MRVIAVPAETPEEIQAELAAAFETAFNNPEFRQKAEELGITPFWMDGEESEAFVTMMQERATAMLDQLAEAGEIGTPVTCRLASRPRHALPVRSSDPLA